MVYLSQEYIQKLIILRMLKIEKNDKEENVFTSIALIFVLIFAFLTFVV